MRGDVEVNPGHKHNSNSLIAHSFAKVSLLMAYFSVNNFDIICLSEAFLNSKTPTDDENLQIPGYSIA